MKLNRIKYASALLAAISLASPVTALAEQTEQTDPQPQKVQAKGKLTLEDIFRDKKFNAKGILSLQWDETGKGYYTLEPDASGEGHELIHTDIESAKKSVIISGTPFDIQDYSFSADMTKAILYTNSEIVWRTAKRGEYYLYDLTDRSCRKLGKEEFEPSRMSFAKFSPDGTKIAYLYKNNIYTENVSDGEITQLTYDGSEIIINGDFDWVYEEELGLHDGFRWSPDSRHIAYWQFDTEGTGTFYMVNNIDSIYSEIIPLPYPKAGTTNSACRIGIVNADGTEQTRWLDIPGDPREHYLARMEFIPGESRLIIQQLNRLQNTNKVFCADALTCEVTPFFEDHEETFLNVYNTLKWGKKNSYFTWMSEKDGYRTLYRVSADRSKITPITGEFDILSVDNIDTEKEYVYYTATPDVVTDSYLFRSKIRKNGKVNVERLTPEGEAGYHTYNISPDSKYAVHSFSSNETPTRYELISLPDHKVIRVLEDNEEVAENFAAAQTSPKEYFRVDIGETQLDGWMIKPDNFDPSQKYPTIFYIYGEPASSTILNKWSGPREMFEKFLAQQGYIVISVDPRGTNIPRGKEWRKCVYGKVGIIPPADHAAAVEKLKETYQYIDASRIGVWGWSGGGSSTAHLMFKYPDIYSTGIAVAGVYSQYLYDTIYQERYMGLPSTNPEGFHNGSPINFAKNLKGNLLLIHGTGDDNVHYQSTEMLANELIRQNKFFYMISYPMRAHSIYERENTSLHLYRSMFKYWLEKLPVNE